MKIYPTKTQAEKAKKFGQTIHKRKDNSFTCVQPKPKQKKVPT